MITRAAALLELAALDLALVDAKIARFERLDTEDQAAFGTREMAMTADLPEYGALLRARERLEDFALGLVATPPAGWTPGAGTVQAEAHGMLH